MRLTLAGYYMNTELEVIPAEGAGEVIPLSPTTETAGLVKARNPVALTPEIEKANIERIIAFLDLRVHLHTQGGETKPNMHFIAVMRRVFDLDIRSWHEFEEVPQDKSTDDYIAAKTGHVFATGYAELYRYGYYIGGGTWVRSTFEDKYKSFKRLRGEWQNIALAAKRKAIVEALTGAFPVYEAIFEAFYRIGKTHIIEKELERGVALAKLQRFPRAVAIDIGAELGLREAEIFPPKDNYNS